MKFSIISTFFIVLSLTPKSIYCDQEAILEEEYEEIQYDENGDIIGEIVETEVEEVPLKICYEGLGIFKSAVKCPNASSCATILTPGAFIYQCGLPDVYDECRNVSYAHIGVYSGIFETAYCPTDYCTATCGATTFNNTLVIWFVVAVFFNLQWIM